MQEPIIPIAEESVSVDQLAKEQAHLDAVAVSLRPLVAPYVSAYFREPVTIPGLSATIADGLVDDEVAQAASCLSLSWARILVECDQAESTAYPVAQLNELKLSDNQTADRLACAIGDFLNDDDAVSLVRRLPEVLAADSVMQQHLTAILQGNRREAAE